MWKIDKNIDPIIAQARKHFPLFNEYKTSVVTRCSGEAIFVMNKEFTKKEKITFIKIDHPEDPNYSIGYSKERDVLFVSNNNIWRN